MAGGTYHDHEDVEKLMGVTLASTGEWPLDSDVDNEAVQTEGEVDGAIAPFTLVEANSFNTTSLTANLARYTLYSLMLDDRWRRARGSDSSSTGNTPFSSPESIVNAQEKYVANIKRLAMGTPSWDTAPLIKEDTDN